MHLNKYSFYHPEVAFSGILPISTGKMGIMAILVLKWHYSVSNVGVNIRLCTEINKYLQLLSKMGACVSQISKNQQNQAQYAVRKPLISVFLLLFRLLL